MCTVDVASFPIILSCVKHILKQIKAVFDKYLWHAINKSLSAMTNGKTTTPTLTKGGAAFTQPVCRVSATPLFNFKHAWICKSGNTQKCYPSLGFCRWHHTWDRFKVRKWELHINLNKYSSIPPCWMWAVSINEFLPSSCNKSSTCGTLWSPLQSSSSSSCPPIWLPVSGSIKG